MNLATPLPAVLLLARPGDHETSVAELPRSRVVSNPKDEIPHNGGWIALNLPLPASADRHPVMKAFTSDELKANQSVLAMASFRPRAGSAIAIEPC